jgi:hypothetical protein
MSPSTNTARGPEPDGFRQADRCLPLLLPTHGSILPAFRLRQTRQIPCISGEKSATVTTVTPDGGESTPEVRGGTFGVDRKQI